MTDVSKRQRHLGMEMGQLSYRAVRVGARDLTRHAKYAQWKGSVDLLRREIANLDGGQVDKLTTVEAGVIQPYRRLYLLYPYGRKQEVYFLWVVVVVVAVWVILRLYQAAHAELISHLLFLPLLLFCQNYLIYS